MIGLGLDPDEKSQLKNIVMSINTIEELNWVNQLVDTQRRRIK